MNIKLRVIRILSIPINLPRVGINPPQVFWAKKVRWALELKSITEC